MLVRFPRLPYLCEVQLLVQGCGEDVRGEPGCVTPCRTTATSTPSKSPCNALQGRQACLSRTPPLCRL